MRSIDACLVFALLAGVQLAAAAENAAQPPSCGVSWNPTIAATISEGEELPDADREQYS